jgi:hypothetical protein
VEAPLTVIAAAASALLRPSHSSASAAWSTCSRVIILFTYEVLWCQMAAVWPDGMGGNPGEKRPRLSQTHLFHRLLRVCLMP